MRTIKQHYIPIILIILGIIDQSTDLFIQLINELNLKPYCLTIFRIIVISLGAIKLYITNANKMNNGE